MDPSHPNRSERPHIWYRTPVDPQSPTQIDPQSPTASSSLPLPPATPSPSRPTPASTSLSPTTIEVSKNVARVTTRFPNYAQWCAEWEAELMAANADIGMEDEDAKIDMEDEDDDIDMEDEYTIERLLNFRLFKNYTVLLLYRKNQETLLSMSSPQFSETQETQETPDLKNWFPSYEYESPPMDTTDDFKA